MNNKKHHLVCFTGAGISQESGLGTFRSTSGMWENNKIEEIASPEGFAKNPQLILDFYSARKDELDQVSPNDAHYLIAKFDAVFLACNNVRAKYGIELEVLATTK